MRRRGGGSEPTLLRLERWGYKAARQLGSEAAKRDLEAKTKRCEDAKRHSLLLLRKFDLFRKIVDILSLVKRNILLSPLEGEKKFLSELCELRNFREGYKKYKNSDRATECAMTDVGEKKGKIKMNKNNLQQKQPNNPAASPETNHSPLTIHHSPKRIAFTLAEVLITLGIIGIVVALTIPNLVQGYRKHVVETRLKEFYTITQQAFKMAEVDNGDITNWGKGDYTYVANPDVYFSNSDVWFSKYISPYLKEERLMLKRGFLAGAYFRKLPNGSAFVFNTNGSYFFPFSNDYYKCSEYGDEKRIKQCSGTKYFNFGYSTDSRITPFDYPFHTYKKSWPYAYYRNVLRREQLVGNIGTCSKKSIEANREAHYCAELIMLEGWKIPKDYPFRF